MLGERSGRRGPCLLWRRSEVGLRSKASLLERTMNVSAPSMWTPSMSTPSMWTPSVSTHLITQRSPLCDDCTGLLLGRCVNLFAEFVVNVVKTAIPLQPQKWVPVPEPLNFLQTRIVQCFVVDTTSAS